MDPKNKEQSFSKEVSEEQSKRRKALEMINLWMEELENKNLKQHEGEGEQIVNNSIKEEYPIILNAKDIGEILKVSRPTAYEIMNQNNFPLIKIRGCKRVLRDEFLAWLANKSEEGDKAKKNKT